MKQDKKNEEGMKEFSIGVTETRKWEIPEIDDGVYDAFVEELELKTDLPDGEGGLYDMIQWNFNVSGKSIQGKTSTTISTLSKAYGWIKAITGNELEINKDFQPNQVISKQCQVIVKHNKREISFNNEKKIMDIPYVHDVLPTKK